MADMLQILQDFLCYGNTNCIQLFQQYSYKPMEGLFYAVFAPILFILLLVWIVSSAVGTLRGFWGYRVLLGFAVFAFIILQGWYYFFAMLGQFWLFVLVILGIFWVIVHTIVGRKEKEATGAGRVGDISGAGGGVLGKAAGRVVRNVRGDVQRCRNQINRALEQVKAVQKAVESGHPQAWRMASDAIVRLEQLRNEYVQLLQGPGGFVYGGNLKKVDAQIDKAIKSLQHLQSQVQKE